MICDLNSNTSPSNRILNRFGESAKFYKNNSDMDKNRTPKCKRTSQNMLMEPITGQIHEPHVCKSHNYQSCSLQGLHDNPRRRRGNDMAKR